MKPSDTPLRGAGNSVRVPVAIAAAVLLLWLAVSGGAVAAARPAIGHSWKVSASVAPSVPAMLDCCPCADCQLAPAPSLHSFGGEAGAARQIGWHALVERRALPGKTLATRRRPARVPVRIAYCRWRD